MLPTGTLIDPYEILGPLGRGGMGEVYKARDTRVDRVVAVKVLPSSSAGAFDAEGRFQREARALAALSHPRICALFEFTRYDGLPGAERYYFVRLTTRHLLFAPGDVLYAQSFDTATAQARDVPIVIAEGLARDRYGRVSASVAGEGLLIYQQEVPGLRQLVWMDRDGRQTGSLGEGALQMGLDMTDDGNLVAVERRSARGSGLWLIDVRRGVTRESIRAASPSDLRCCRETV